MDTHYPYHHSHLHPVPGTTVQPICVYCLHLLVVEGVSLSDSMQRSIMDKHECVEKMTARHITSAFFQVFARGRA
jgi:hypothetical protein